MIILSDAIVWMFYAAVYIAGIIGLGWVALIIFDGLIGQRLLAARKAKRDGKA